jgi:hypothetical protein
MSLIETHEPDHAEPFVKMAADISRNPTAKFGGAAVLMPPGGAEPVELLFLGQDNAALFWAALKSLVEQKLVDIDAMQRGLTAGFNRR